MTTNLHQQILNEFLNSNIKIKSLDKLNEYIAYCINNNQNKPIKSKTSHHHILPKAKDCFPELENLKVNKWNGTHLMYFDHYYAHWLMTEAINNYSQLYAFCAMHNMDTKKGRILESNLIPAEEFQEKMKEREHKRRIRLKSIDDKTGLTQAQLNGIKISDTMKKINPETGISTYQMNGIKMSKTITEINPETGMSIIQLSNIKSVNTKSKIDPETGLSIHQKIGIKNTKTRAKIDPSSGLSGFQKAGIKQSKTLQAINPKTGIRVADEHAKKRCKMYDVYHIDKGIIISNISTKDLPFSHHKNSKDNYLGMSYHSRNAIKEENKIYIGCYVIKK